MGDQATTLQAPASEHRIRASAVKAALTDCNRRRGIRASRCVALSAHVYSGACGRSWRDAWSYRSRLGMEPLQFRSRVSWICGIDLVPVVEKVRAAGGPAEVKKTWGVGYRALMASLNPEKGEVTCQ